MQLLTTQDSHDEQQTVCIISSGFVDMILVMEEILSEQRQPLVSQCILYCSQVIKATVKVFGLG